MGDPGLTGPRHSEIRGLLRAVGVVLVIVGGILALIGFVDFFASFGSFRPPRLFGCAFAGLGLLGVGMAICRYAFLGAVARYVPGEVAPVATDTLDYVGEEGAEGIEAVAGAVGRGLRAASDENEDESPGDVTCPTCHTPNAPDARFCKQCGAELQRKCAHCGGTSAPDARFCDDCGRRFE